MRNPIFDYDDGDFIYQTSGNMGIDSDGNLHMRMGDNISMDMDTGELHFNSGWRNDDEDDDFYYSLSQDYMPWLLIIKGELSRILFYLLNTQQLIF